MKRGASYDPNLPMSSSFHAQMNNLVNDSPVTMMDMSEEKGALNAVGNMMMHDQRIADFNPHDRSLNF